MKWSLLSLALACAAMAQPRYDLLLKGGHVIDPKNGLSKPLDVAVAAGKIARVAPSIPAAEARLVADVTGLYVTPGLVDMHAHVYAGTGARGLAGDQSVYPDGFSFRTGVTTMVDAGTAGWRNFPDFVDRVASRSKTRVLAFLNICGVGMPETGENNPEDMDVAKAVAVARRYPNLIVGYKVAHYARPDFLDVERAVEAGRQTDRPIMVDFGDVSGPRNIKTLLEEKLRPGDIYTHSYSGVREEQVNGAVNPAMLAARKRGVIFDLGHGGGSFFWNIAVPAFEQGFWPDSVSTDLHGGSMNGGMKDLPNVMSKVLNLGVPLEQVIAMATWNPARQIKHPELGSLDVGAEADITALALERGAFGFLDSAGARRAGDRKLTVELTIRKGAVAWDLNGRAAVDWKSYPYKQQRARR
jgi:dihydroorotase